MKKELVVELAKVVRELQPNAMLCSRIGHGMGDYASKGDMEVPTVNIADCGKPATPTTIRGRTPGTITISRVRKRF